MKYGVSSKIPRPAIIVTAFPLCDDISDTTSPFNRASLMLSGILRLSAELVKGLVSRVLWSAAMYEIPAWDGTIFAGMYSSH